MSACRPHLASDSSLYDVFRTSLKQAHLETSECDLFSLSSHHLHLRAIELRHQPFFTETTVSASTKLQLPPCATRTGTSSSTRKAATCLSASSRPLATRSTVATRGSLARTVRQPVFGIDGVAKLLTSQNRHQSDTACRLFRPGDSSRNAVHRLTALVGAAGSSWATDFAGRSIPRTESVMASQDHRRWLPYLVSSSPFRRPIWILRADGSKSKGAALPG